MVPNRRSFVIFEWNFRNQRFTSNSKHQISNVNWFPGLSVWVWLHARFLKFSTTFCTYQRTMSLSIGTSLTTYSECILDLCTISWADNSPCSRLSLSLSHSRSQSNAMEKESRAHRAPHHLNVPCAHTFISPGCTTINQRRLNEPLICSQAM